MLEKTIQDDVNIGRALIEGDVPPLQSPRTDRVTALYLGCKTNKSPDIPSTWVPIYRFSWDDKNNFYYSFTNGFKDNYERLKGHIINPNCGFNQTWITKHLDSRIGSRIPRRADSMGNYDLLGIKDLKGDYIAYLARSGGKRVGDNYDIFPEVQCDNNGYYHFHFLIVDFGNRVSQGNEQLKLIADTVEISEILKLEIEEERSRILCRGMELGYCPEYINYLLKFDKDRDRQIKIERVNSQCDIYGRKIVVSLQLKFSSPPWQLKDFEPLNFMPV